MLSLHASSPAVLHRDLKSPNLLLDSRGVIKVSDFNLATLLDASLRATSMAAMNPRWLVRRVGRGWPLVWRQAEVSLLAVPAPARLTVRGVRALPTHPTRLHRRRR